jgi:hypothetical protein
MIAISFLQDCCRTLDDDDNKARASVNYSPGQQTVIGNWQLAAGNSGEIHK